MELQEGDVIYKKSAYGQLYTAKITRVTPKFAFYGNYKFGRIVGPNGKLKEYDANKWGSYSWLAETPELKALFEAQEITNRISRKIELLDKNGYLSRLSNEELVEFEATLDKIINDRH